MKKLVALLLFSSAVIVSGETLKQHKAKFLIQTSQPAEVEAEDAGLVVPEEAASETGGVTEDVI